MRFSPKRRIYLDSPDLTMAENNTLEHESPVETEDQPKSQFAKDFREVMARKGFSPQKLLDAVNARGKVTLKDRRITYYRSTADYKSAADCRKVEELQEIAIVMGVTIDDFFPKKETESAKSGPDRDRAHQLLDEALKGPKRNFVLDALVLAASHAIANEHGY